MNIFMLAVSSAEAVGNCHFLKRKLFFWDSGLDCDECLPLLVDSWFLKC